MRYVQSHSRKQFQPDPVTWTDPKDANKDRIRDTEEAANEDYNVGDQMMNLDVLDGYADDISFEIDTGSEGMSEEDKTKFAEEEMCIVFICGDKTSVPHQVGFHR